MTLPPSKQTNSTRGKLANRLALRRAAKARRNAREARRSGAPHAKVTLRGKLSNRLALRRAAKARRQARTTRTSDAAEPQQSVDSRRESTTASAPTPATDGGERAAVVPSADVFGESADTDDDSQETARSPAAAGATATATEPAAPKRSLGRTVLNVVGIALLIALVVPFAVYAVPDLAGADQSYVVLTGSMTPAIAPGDVVIVDSVDPATIAVGDVVTFERAANNPPVTHRVIEVVQTENGPAYVTKGDANEDPDTSLVYPNQLVGRVLVTFPYIGHVIEFGNSTNGFLLLVVTPFALLILTEIAAFVRSGRGDEGETAAASAAAVPTAAETTNAAGSAETAETDEPEGFVLTANDLNLALLSFALFAGYAAYVAYTYRGTLTLGVAVATVTALLLGLGVRLFGFRSSESEPAAAATDGGVDEGGEH
ncbi:signal peptidase I [Halogranum gelatinilyticum]|uniref:Signal peptidase I n=1 Tax=Halogranum gelatinilyticum TaxID=660521 RepID=A0A1G9SMP7_9EURY|nr:signal peptidase I [Halogranum gelatinilyticum]SDM36607.1 signal peptidase I [Halogranum gelatinilyticum]